VPLRPGSNSCGLRTQGKGTGTRCTLCATTTDLTFAVIFEWLKVESQDCHVRESNWYREFTWLNLLARGDRSEVERGCHRCSIAIKFCCSGKCDYTAEKSCMRARKRSGVHTWTLTWEVKGQTVGLSAELRRVEFCTSQPFGPAIPHNTFLITF